jgi:hypothetical protein
MDKTIREILEAPFPDEEIRTRKGTFGKELAYAEVHNYIAKLNLAFAGDWSFDIIEHVIQDNEVMVLGRLTAGDIHKSAFGCSTITTTRESGERVSLGHDLKAAASDALKKCCSLLGLGLHLYGLESSPERKEPNGTVPFPGAAKSNQTINGQLLTSRQYGAIVAIAEKAGYSEAQLKTRILNVHGVPLEKLDRRTASQVISELCNGNGRAAGGAS